MAVHNINQQGLYAALAKPRLAFGKYRARATNGVWRGISQSPGSLATIYSIFYQLVIIGNTFY
jgi:hypothetical protein